MMDIIQGPVINGSAQISLMNLFLGYPSLWRDLDTRHGFIIGVYRMYTSKISPYEAPTYINTRYTILFLQPSSRLESIIMSLWIWYRIKKSRVLQCSTILNIYTQTTAKKMQYSVNNYRTTDCFDDDELLLYI